MSRDRRGTDATRGSARRSARARPASPNRRARRGSRGGRAGAARRRGRPPRAPCRRTWRAARAAWAARRRRCAASRRLPPRAGSGELASPRGHRDCRSCGLLPRHGLRASGRPAAAGSPGIVTQAGPTRHYRPRQGACQPSCNRPLGASRPLTTVVPKPMLGRPCLPSATIAAIQAASANGIGAAFPLSRLAAVIFDMDGVITDTATVHRGLEGALRHLPGAAGRPRRRS